MSGDADIIYRLAQDADNADLIALSAACPMRAAMTLCVHREPDFFALSRLMGDPHYVFVAEDQEQEKKVVGCVAGAVRDVWVDGQPKSVMYTGDFKLHPRSRGRGIADRLLATGWPQCEAVGVPSLMGVLVGNAPIERRIKTPPPPLPKPTLFGTVRVYTLLLPGLKLSRAPAEVRVRPATRDDLPAMEALWARVGPLRNGAPVLDAERLLRFIEVAPGLALSDYLLAFRGGDLLGSMAVWDQSAFKDTEVLDFGRSVELTRRAHDLIARPLGWPLLPKRGGRLRSLNALHVFVPPTEVGALSALIHAARARCVEAGAPVFELGLDPRDPLVRAVRPFPRVSLDVRFYLTPDPGRAEAPRVGSQPLYFETALV